MVFAVLPSRKSTSESVADLLNERYQARLNGLHQRHLASDLALRVTAHGTPIGPGIPQAV
jgi:hypothetical protein